MDEKIFHDLIMHQLPSLAQQDRDALDRGEAEELERRRIGHVHNLGHRRDFKGPLWGIETRIHCLKNEIYGRKI